MNGRVSEIQGLSLDCLNRESWSKKQVRNSFSNEKRIKCSTVGCWLSVNEAVHPINPRNWVSKHPHFFLFNWSSFLISFFCSDDKIFYCYFAGDEILAVNGLALQGMSHAEAISVFKNIRTGKVLLHVARRDATMRR